MRVSESVRAVQVPDDNPMHPDFTSIYIVGKDQVLTIDSGETMERYRWMLRGDPAATEKAEIALAGITHHHADHSGNLKWVREAYKADVLVAKSGVPMLKGKLPARGVGYLSEGQEIDMGAGTKVQVLATPGHSVDSVCYYIEDEGVLFSGDTLLGSSTTTVHDLGAYRRSLRRLLELPNLKVICPGHGPLVHDPRERLESYIKHRDMRERQILGVLEGGGALSSWTSCCCSTPRSTSASAVQPKTTFASTLVNFRTKDGSRSTPVRRSARTQRRGNVECRARPRP